MNPAILPTWNIRLQLYSSITCESMLYMYCIVYSHYEQLILLYSHTAETNTPPGVCLVVTDNRNKLSRVTVSDPDLHPLLYDLHPQLPEILL